VTTTRDHLRGVLAPARCVLLDFDGPVCAVFATRTAAAIAERLRPLLDGAAQLPPDAGPHDVLSTAAHVSPDLGARVETALAAEEIEAVGTATPTPGAADFLAACARSGRQVVIVSNNPTAAVLAYLRRAQLNPYVAHVIGRHPRNAALMKPAPYLVRAGLYAADVPPDLAVLIGDSATDVEAAHAACVQCIGYANQPGKDDQLHAAGADAIVTSMRQLTEVIRPVRSA